jgi:RNA polymerase sigma-70 factor, ECF subfamily
MVVMPPRHDRPSTTDATTEREQAVTAQLITAQRGYLLRFARTRLRDAATAEDAVQDALLAAFQTLDRFEQRASLRTWLTGILVNKIADAVRRDRRAGSGGASSDGGDSDGGGGDASAVPGDEPVRAERESADWRDPERVLAGRQAAHALAAGLSGIAPLARQVFMLREIEGLSNTEAALELGVTPEHGAMLLHRTRARLRRGLREARVL